MTVLNLLLKAKKEKCLVRNGIRTHAHISGPDLESGALDRSATLTVDIVMGFLQYTWCKVKSWKYIYRKSLQAKLHLVKKKKNFGEFKPST